MGNCYTLHPQDQQFQGGVHQPKKNLFRHSQDSFSWQNSQEQIQREPVNDGRQPSGFYEPQFPRVMAVEKDIRNPVSQDPYPLVSDWEARSGVKEYGRQEEPFAPNMLGWHQNHHNQPQAIQNLPPAPIGWSPDPHAMNQQEVLSHSEADRFLSQGNSQWQVSETPSPQRQPESRGQAFGSPSQFVSLTPSGNMFPHEPSAPVGEASVFLIGGKSTFRSTDALVEQGMR